MSRHRYVRNLAEEDYYDDYDDDEDDYYEEEDQQHHEYRAPKATTATFQAKIPATKSTTAAAISTAATTATTASKIAAPAAAAAPKTAANKSTVAAPSGVTKPPPGWDRPSSQPTPTTSLSSKSPKKPVNPGITKPPPGWGKPQPASSSSSSATTTTASATNQTKSALSATATTTTSSLPAAARGGTGVTKPPPGWGKPPTTTTVKNDSNVKKTLSSSSSESRTPVTLDFTNKTNHGAKSSTSKNTPATATIITSSSSSASAPPKPLPKSVLDSLQSLQQLKSQLTMVVMGHVDAGKSTLVGQLLVQCGQVSTRVAQKYEQQATSIGKSSFGLAWILDETEQERSRGVTMDVATKSLSLEQHDIILLDAPGHADFVPRMITGASSATVGLLVIAATPNEFDAGWNRGQTKEHVILARGLGVTQLIVAMNKLDMVQWNEARYQEIVQRVHPFLIQQGFAPERITYCPISGLSGVNIMKQTKEDAAASAALYQWYSGPTLLQAMNRLLPVPRNVLLEKPFRMIVTDIYSDGSSSHKTVQIRGRVMQGVVQLHDACVLLPIGDETTIAKMETFVAATTATTTSASSTTSTHNNPGEFAMAGELVDVTLTGIESSMRVSVGSILSHSHIPLRPRISKRCRAKVWILPDLPPVVGPILRGVQVLFHMHHLDIPATISKLHYIISKATDVGVDQEDANFSVATNAAKSSSLAPSAAASSTHAQQQPQAQRPRFLSGGVTAVVDITLNDRICMENFVDCRPLGRFVLRKSGETIAVGVIDGVL